MEEYFDKGDVVGRDAEALHQDAARSPARSARCCAAPRSRTRACSRCSTRCSTTCPRPIDVPGITVAADEGEEERDPRPPPHQGRPERAVRRPGVQDHQRQIRHADLRARLCRHAEVAATRCMNTTKGHRERIGRMFQMHADKRAEIKEVACRRHRRLRRPEGHRHRRHAGLRRRPGGAGAHGVPGAR